MTLVVKSLGNSRHQSGSTRSKGHALSVPPGVDLYAATRYRSPHKAIGKFGRSTGLTRIEITFPTSTPFQLSITLYLATIPPAVVHSTTPTKSEPITSCSQGSRR